MPETSDPGSGYVFAATGERYINLARRTARNLRQVAPSAVIDLFADRELDDEVFDRIHRLQGRAIRPKMEALSRSRFGRTIYLDADVVAVADPSDLFGILNRADLAGIHEQYGNYDVRENADRPDIPASFREINTGVIAIKSSEALSRLLTDWHETYTERGHRLDQPVLRELLWDRPEIRLAVVPMEYNLMHTRLIRSFGKRMNAPRLLHITGLHEKLHDDANPENPVDLTEALAPETLSALAELLKRDRSLGGTPPIADRISERLRSHPKTHAAARRWWKRLRR